MTTSISDRVALLASRVGAEFKSVRDDVSDLEQTIPTVEFLASLFIEIAHPVGSWYASDDPTDPSVLFAGTTWQRLTGKRGLIACDDSLSVGSESGKSSMTLTVEQLPSHTHSQKSCDTRGSHSHSRGDMNITGTHGQISGRANHVGTGAFSGTTAGSNYSYSGYSSSGAGRNFYLDFDASKNWEGNTNGAGGHSHTVTLNNTGSGQAIDIMNPYHATYIWKRIS